MGPLTHLDLVDHPANSLDRAGALPSTLKSSSTYSARMEASDGRYQGDRAGGGGARRAGADRRGGELGGEDGGAGADRARGLRGPQGRRDLRAGRLLDADGGQVARALRARGDRGSQGRAAARSALDPRPRGPGAFDRQGLHATAPDAVSYTHLTLPTIYSV